MLKKIYISTIFKYFNNYGNLKIKKIILIPSRIYLIFDIHNNSCQLKIEIETSKNRMKNYLMIIALARIVEYFKKFFFL